MMGWQMKELTENHFPVTARGLSAGRLSTSVMSWSGPLAVTLSFSMWLLCQRLLQGSAGTQALVASFPGLSNCTRPTLLWSDMWERWRIRLLWPARDGECSGFLPFALPHCWTRQDPTCSWAQGGCPSSSDSFAFFLYQGFWAHSNSHSTTTFAISPLE